MDKLIKKGIDTPDIDILKVFKRLFRAYDVKVRQQTLKETARLHF